MKKILLLLVIFSNFSFGQELVVSTNRNPAILGEQISLEFSIEAKATNFKSPIFKGFRIVSGPNTSSSSSYSFANGKSESKIITKFSFILQTIEEGNFIIPIANVDVKGKKISSKPSSIKVVKGNNKKSNKSIEDNLFIKVEVNKKNPFVGEQIIVTYKLHTRLDLENTEVSAIPNLNGFWKKDLETSSRFKREVVNGIAYNTATIKKAVLTPQKSGELIIDPMEVKCSIRTQNKQNRRDPFANFFNSYNVREEFISSKQKRINVKALPSNEPKNFNGTVGNYTVSSSIDKNSLKTNEAVTYKIKLTGTGNIDLIEPFKIEFPNDFEVYDPKINDRVFQGGNKRSTKTFEYLLIPRVIGNYKIPKYSFSFFNPKSQKFETKNTESYSIQILKGNDEEYQSNNTQQIIKQNSKDINYIKVKTLLKQKKQSSNINIFYISYSFLLLLILILIFLPKFISEKFKKIKNLQSVKYAKIASKRLKNAQKCIKTNNYDLFFEEIEKSLWGYFADKFKVQIADLSKNSISQFFKKHDIQTNTEKEFISLINECEFARYAPSNDKNNQMDNLLIKAKEIIIQVESQSK